MSRIKHVHARRIWDSRGRPTVEVDVITESGALGRGIAPAGASRGTREAHGLGAEVDARLDGTVTIPLREPAESLNVAMAARALVG